MLPRPEANILTVWDLVYRALKPSTSMCYFPAQTQSSIYETVPGARTVVFSNSENSQHVEHRHPVASYWRMNEYVKHADES